MLTNQIPGTMYLPGNVGRNFATPFAIHVYFYFTFIPPFELL